MAWARLDPAMPWHPKVAALSDRAFRLHATGICYCVQYLTDGAIPAKGLRGIFPWGSHHKPLLELVAAGLWHDEGDHYEIHDFLEYNPTAEEVLAQRAARSAAGRAGGRRSGQVRARKREANAKQVLDESGSKNEAESNLGLGLIERDGANAPSCAARAAPGDVDRVWQAYQEHHPRSVLTPERRRLIQRRLAAYPAETLIDAVHGNHRDPYCSGENPTGKTYHELELILRNADKIEKYAGITATAAPPRLRVAEPEPEYVPIEEVMRRAREAS